MSGTVLCVAVVMLGVNFSVQPLPEGGVEYVIHLDPLNLESLRSGNDLRSDLPTTAKDVRSFRITLASVQPTGPALSSPAPAPTPKSRPPRTRPSVPSGSDFVIPRGGGFPTAPPGILPMPKETANPIQGERPVVPAKAEQGPIAAPAVPPAVEKPQPPRASSQTAVSAVEPETSQESPGLLYSLAASTIARLVEWFSSAG